MLILIVSPEWVVQDYKERLSKLRSKDKKPSVSARLFYLNNEIIDCCLDMFCYL